MVCAKKMGWPGMRLPDCHIFAIFANGFKSVRDNIAGCIAWQVNWILSVDAYRFW